MKKTLIFSALLALVLGACNSSSNKNEQANSTDSTSSQSGNVTQVFNLDTTKLQAGATFYQCEMDADVISDKPGTCPKCGMDLSEIKKN